MRKTDRERCLHSLGVDGRRIQFQFCVPPQLRTCSEGEVSTEVQGGLRQSFKCICPENTRQRSTGHRLDPNSDIVQYTCESVSSNVRTFTVFWH